jgi:hypothetical protein
MSETAHLQRRLLSMLAESSYLQKLWNRGVDIGVGVITSVLIAGVGLLFWRFKLRLDLRADERRQRQQHRIAEEIEAAKRREAKRELRDRLRVEMDLLAAQAEAAADAFQLARCWETYLQWLLENQLNLLRGNLKTVNERAAWGPAIRDTATRNTELPGGGGIARSPNSPQPCFCSRLAIRVAGPLSRPPSTTRAVALAQRWQRPSCTGASARKAVRTMGITHPTT